MKFDIDKLHSVALPPSEASSRRTRERREKRRMLDRSSAIALKVSRAMEKREISREELARLLDISEGDVLRFLSGKENMDLKTMVDLEEALGVTIIDQSVSPWSPWRREQMAKWKKELEEEQERTGFRLEEEPAEIWIEFTVELKTTIEMDRPFRSSMLPEHASSHILELPHILHNDLEYDLESLGDKEKPITDGVFENFPA